MDFKKKIGTVAVVLALMVGSYAAGRYVTPAKVIITEKVVTVKETQVVTVVETDKILNALKTVNRQNDVKMVKVTQQNKDGSVTTTETREDKTKTLTEAKTDVKEHEKASENKKEVEIQEREVTKTVVATEHPDWSLALQPGFDVAGALGRGSPYSLFPDTVALKHVVVGLSVEHHLIGPLSTGVWGNTSGAAGITIRLDF